MRMNSLELNIDSAVDQQVALDKGSQPAKGSWMQALASHYDWIRRAHPDRKLLLAMDIDGTIIDMRNHVAHALRVFDRQHGTEWFSSLRAEEIGFHESRLHEFLQTLPIPPLESLKIEEFVTEYWWGEDAIFAAHQPFAGALEVARWFQLQPRTEVVFVTGRPERIRERTLASLQRLGDAHRLRVTDDQLKMKRDHEDVPAAKIRSLTDYASEGCVPFAFIDNEPENLAAVYLSRQFDDTLLLHADTIFLSSRSLLPESSLSGRDYELLGLASLGHVPDRIQFVWHGANTSERLDTFVSSSAHWAEMDIRRNPNDGKLVLGDTVVAAAGDPTADPAGDEEAAKPLELGPALMRLKESGRAAKLDIKEQGILKETVATCREAGLDGENLWFSADLADLSPVEFKYLSARYPMSTIQTPIDDFAAQMVADESMGRRVLDHLRLTGINRVSVSATHRRLHRLITNLQEAGWAVNVYNVKGLEEFLRSILLTPDSITSDFDFNR